MKKIILSCILIMITTGSIRTVYGIGNPCIVGQRFADAMAKDDIDTAWGCCSEKYKKQVTYERFNKSINDSYTTLHSSSSAYHFSSGNCLPARTLPYSEVQYISTFEVQNTNPKQTVETVTLLKMVIEGNDWKVDEVHMLNDTEAKNFKLKESNAEEKSRNDGRQ